MKKKPSGLAATYLNLCYALLCELTVRRGGHGQLKALVILWHLGIEDRETETDRETDAIGFILQQIENISLKLLCYNQA